MSEPTPVRSGAKVVGWVPPLPVPPSDADVRRALADEVDDALGDRELLPAAVADRFADLLHRWRTGREL